jgi:hypothetical protein
MTPEQISSMTKKQIDKFVALANTNLFNQQATITYQEGIIYFQSANETDARIIQLDDLIGLADIPNIPDFWPTDMLKDWPPTYLDDGGTYFDSAMYYKFEDRAYQRRILIEDREYQTKLRKQAEAAQGKIYSTGQEAEAAARAATEASIPPGPQWGAPGDLSLPPGIPLQQWEAVGLPGGGYTIQTVEPEEPREVWLDTETDTEGGWVYEVYGYTDADGDHITKKVPRATKDPKQSLDNLIALALGEVDNWSAEEGTDDYNSLQRAQRLFDFKNQPTDAERLRLAMDIAQSPSDYMTLVGLYTGAISSEGVGGKVAPLMPYLQQMAQKFFLDIPGINDMTATGRQQEVVELPRDEYISDIPGEDWTEPGSEVYIPPPIVSPVDTSMSQDDWFVPDKDYGRRYNPTGHWEDYGKFQARTGYESPVVQLAPEDYLSDNLYVDDELTGTGGPWPVGEVPGSTNGFATVDTGFEKGGIVPGKMGEPKLIKAHGGEIVIPNPIRSPYTESLFGPTFTPRRETLGRFLTSPSKVQIPSMPTVQAAQFRFRSPQTIRRMTPTQRSMFQASTQPMFGVPYEDWRMQERLATGAGGSGRPRAQFRRPSFVRG